MTFRGKAALVLGGVVILSAGFALFVSRHLATGMVRVQVDENYPGGDHVSVCFPAESVQLAMALVPGRVRLCAGKDARVWLPAMQAACRELAAAGDCKLVDVHAPGERVSIQVQGQILRIAVDSSREVVRVELPLRLATKVVDRMASSWSESTEDPESPGYGPPKSDGVRL
jgi:hypothetical protein